MLAQAEHQGPACLLQEIRTGRFAQADRLPPENELAAELHVSRGKVRDILAVLEREGYISRLHGVGTLINRQVVDLRSRADVETEFLDLVRANGREPGLRVVGYGETPADEQVAAALGIAPGAPVITASRIVTADRIDLILCENFVDRSRIVRPGYNEMDFLPTVFAFLDRFCGLSPYLAVVDIHAVLATESLASHLGVAAGAPLLRYDRVDYNVERQPILYSRQHFVEGVLQNQIVRMRL